MKRAILASLGLAALAVSASAQQVTPVWLQHINGSVNANPADKLPVITKNIGKNYATAGVGLSDQFALGKMRPYDATRHLLMVKENGINESDANLTQAQKDLAAAYPDRSLVWIEASTGKPLGIAHVFGVRPITATGQASNNDFWSNWDIDEGPAGERALYSTHKNVILRWAPKTGGGWESTPTCAWTEPTPGAKDCDGNDLDGSSGGDGNVSWRWRDFRVTGSGPSTTFVAGGGTWRASMHTQIFKTEDGLKFYPIARFNDRDGGRKGGYSQGGNTSSLVQYGLDPARPNLAVAYHGRYPGTGYEARPSRFVLDLDNPTDTLPDTYAPGGSVGLFQVNGDAAGDLPAFQWEAAGVNGLPINHAVDGVEYYDGNWGGILDANADVDYVVNYAFPSWNNQFGAIKKPGWIGVHRLDGSIASNTGYKLPFTELDIEAADAGAQVGNEFGYDGDVKIYPDPTAPKGSGKATVFWVASGYGYGVFTIEKVAASITTEPADVTVTENADVVISANIAGSPNTYKWQKNGVDLDPAATRDDGSPYYPATVAQGITKSKLVIPKAQLTDSGKYKLVVTNPLGGVTTREVTVSVTVDNVAPTVVSSKNGRSGDTSYVVLTFSEDVTPETAADAANYKLNGAAVLGAASGGSKIAVVSIPHIDAGVEATLTVSGVKDIAATGNPVAANTEVKLTGPYLVPGSLLWEFYPGITGTAVQGLLDSETYPAFPARWEYMAEANTDTANLSNVADNFGARISGWLTPTVSGSYHFFIASDDASQLLVSTTENAADAVEVASEANCCGGWEAVGAPETSAAIALEAGKSYYVALIYKEGGGGDWARLGWRLENGQTEAGNVAVIPGALFKSYRVLSSPLFNAPSVAGGKVSLTWLGGGTLEESSDLKTWTAVAGNPASPFEVTLPAGGGQKFFRVTK